MQGKIPTDQNQTAPESSNSPDPIQMPDPAPAAHAPACDGSTADLPDPDLAVPKEPPKFSGAAYLKHTQLLDRSGQYNPHWHGMVTPSGKHVDLECRDIGQAFPFFMKESLLACTDLLYEDNLGARLALDTIGQFMAKIWNDSLKDNMSGLCQFRELYKAMDEIPCGREAYANWCAFFVQTYFCYMFTVRKMANGLPEGMCDDVRDYHAMLTALTVLDDDLKKKVVNQWLDRGQWPSNMAYGKLIRRLEDFLEVVKDGQRKRVEYEAKQYRYRNSQRLQIPMDVYVKVAEQTGIPVAWLQEKITEMPKWMLEEIQTDLFILKSCTETGKTPEEVLNYLDIHAKMEDPKNV